MSLTVIVSIWLATDDIPAYEHFERSAATIMSRHGGRITYVYRPENADPFEIHIVTFPDEVAFAAYRADPETIALAPLREQLISRTVVERARNVEPYGA